MSEPSRDSRKEYALETLGVTVPLVLLADEKKAGDEQRQQNGERTRHRRARQFAPVTMGAR